MYNSKYLFSIVLLIQLSFSITKLSSQNYEIRAVNNGGGVISVQCRLILNPLHTATSSITDITFGLRWLESYNINLLTQNTNYNIVKSDVELTQSGYEYQAFGASNTPFLFPETWVVNTWYELLNIKTNNAGVGVGTFEICPTGFNLTTNPNIGVDLNDFTPSINGAADNVPLPLTLISFRAKAQENDILIDWETANEKSVRSFLLEKSENGKIYTPLDASGFITLRRDSILTAKNGISQYYSQLDNQPSLGQNIYRLKWEDEDGKVNYSKIESVMWGKVETFAIFPNPVSPSMGLTVTSNSENNYQFELYDINGRKMLNQMCYKTTQLSVENLPKGFYLYKIKSKVNVVSGKLVIE